MDPDNLTPSSNENLTKWDNLNFYLFQIFGIDDSSPEILKKICFANLFINGRVKYDAGILGLHTSEL